MAICDPDIEQEILFNKPLIAALLGAHAQTQQQQLNMQQLAEIPLITFPASNGPNFSERILGLFYPQGLQVEVIQQVHDLQTALSLVAPEMGFSLVSGQVKTLSHGGF